MQLRDLKWPEVEQREPEQAVLPVGSTEQHGPHAPLGTDSMIATSMARDACEQTDTLCLPPLQVGLAEHHRNFPGTIYVSGETFRKFIQETVESLATHGIENCIIVNGHGGNSSALEEVSQRLTWDSPIHAVMWEWMSSHEGTVDHAGRKETSLILHIQEELIGDPVKGDADSWGYHVSGASIKHNTEDFTQNGATGDARNASAETGKEIFEESVEDLVALIEWFREEEGWE